VYKYIGETSFISIFINKFITLYYFHLSSVQSSETGSGLANKSLCNHKTMLKNS